MKTSHVQLSGKDKLALFTDMSTMLTAGIPILDIIESLRHDARGDTKVIVAALHRSLVNGEPLSHGMAAFPRTFDPVTLNTMRAAEIGGTLEETLQDIVRTLKKELAFSDTIHTAMIYPAFIGVVFLAIILLMLTFVIPRISEVFSSLRVTMPPVTRLMIAMSNFFVANWIPVIVVTLLIAAGMTAFVRANSRAIIRLILMLPGLRRLGTNIDLARMTRSFALLIRTGIPLDEALVLSKRVVRKPEILRAIEHMQRNIDAGRSLGSDLRATQPVIPPIMARSIETAESSGTLEQTLQNLAEYFDEQVADSVKAASALLEPVIIVVIGVMVGALMVTIIAPIYNMISQISSTK
jgi:type II secretory pathway component PulF